MADLKTNYKNDVLDITMDGKRRYQQIDNADGTVSLVDKTVYSQLGDNLGADDINAQNEAINELNNNLTSMVETKYDAESGQPMWKDKGADTWNFFSNSKSQYCDYIYTNNKVQTDLFTVENDGQYYIFAVGKNVNKIYSLAIRKNGSDIISATAYSNNTIGITKENVELKKGDVLSAYTQGSSNDVNNYVALAIINID